MLMNRRSFLQQSSCGVLGAMLAGTKGFTENNVAPTGKRPNILFAIADDWSWPYASVAGAGEVNTPTFDRIAKEGVLFKNTFCAAPQCSPNRAATLTGRHVGQLEEAGTHGSLFPEKFAVYPQLLEDAGYHVGFTGKGWGPGNWEDSGRKRNPAGAEYNRNRLRVPYRGIHPDDYATNFNDFLEKRPDDAPFCFWYGGHEPHRKYEEESGVKAGKKLADVAVPAFLPDNDVVRGDLLDAFLEIEWFDTQLGKMLTRLEEIGELDNTIIVATGDNGMPFPRAKANLYEYGVRVPLAMRWGGCANPGRVSEDLISFVDFAPTFLEAAGVPVPAAMTGKSFLATLTADAPGPNEYVVFGRERHSHARHDNFGYPSRALRTKDHLYIHNFKPDRWPAGDPNIYYDIDDGLTKRELLENKDKYPKLVEMAVGQRPEEELFDITKSMDCMENLAALPEHATTLEQLRKKLDAILKEQQDPRALGTGDIFESYPRFGAMRPELGGFAKQGVYNPKYQAAP